LPAAGLLAAHGRGCAKPPNAPGTPEQAQAEELLDRAIKHDTRALDLFEQSINSWHNLKRTAHMNELERRSCFSTDLRVRYANADLNLAIDGLPRTNDSVDQLIAQARADPTHRPYSVYHGRTRCGIRSHLSRTVGLR